MEELGALAILLESESWFLKALGLIIAAVSSWYFLRSKVRKQFEKVSEKFQKVEGYAVEITTELKEIKVALALFSKQVVELETKHDGRLSALESDVSGIKKDVLDIKIKLQ